jgi:hypothetical protein
MKMILKKEIKFFKKVSEKRVLIKYKNILSLFERKVVQVAHNEIRDKVSP